MEVNELVEQIKGKKLRFSDSWNGHLCTIIVKDFHIGDRETMFIGQNQCGKEDRIYILNKLIDVLIGDGEAKETQEIEYCTVVKTYKLEK